MTSSEIKALLEHLTPAEQEELTAILQADPRPWHPLPGPQTAAYESDATIIGYGGAAGGGKSALACGKSITSHRKVMILRRVGTELVGINDELASILGSREGFNGKDNIWRLKRYDGAELQIELGAVPHAGDETKYQGRPHDLLCFDEATNFLASQVRFLLGWLRTTTPGQKCQALLTFNPPTTTEGRWIVEFFAPWLDPKHPDPADPGEIRYAASLPADATYPNGRDIWVSGPEAFVLVEGRPCYAFNPDDFAPDDIIVPLSRTFIASRITDNPYLMGTGYLSQLQSLPEPLRSQMLKGDFAAGMKDDPWQVIPTAWVEAAQARWERPHQLPPMDSLGVDVARGGGDETIIARRHGNWFDAPVVFPGAETPDGPSVAGLVMGRLRDRAPIHIDVIGVGSSPYDFLREAGQQVLGVNVSEAASAADQSGRLRFKNLRSQLWWQMREALDPANNRGIALPPSPRLLADLCAPTWKLTGSTLYVLGREEIIKKIGRSPDYGSAYILALMDTPKIDQIRALHANPQSYDPYKPLPNSYDPYKY